MVKPTLRTTPLREMAIAYSVMSGEKLLNVIHNHQTVLLNNAVDIPHRYYKFLSIFVAK
jgi:hypothetical protein